MAEAVRPWNPPNDGREVVIGIEEATRTRYDRWSGSNGLSSSSMISQHEFDALLSEISFTNCSDRHLKKSLPGRDWTAHIHVSHVSFSR
jgi:hypothetical protein